jgi:hypothetical protein
LEGLSTGTPVVALTPAAGLLARALPLNKGVATSKAKVLHADASRP